MVEAVLYTEGQNGRLIRTVLGRVKGATSLSVLSKNSTLAEYPLQGRGGSQSKTVDERPDGEANLRLTVGGEEINVADFKAVVGLVLTDADISSHTTLYSFKDRQCSGAEDKPTAAIAYAEIEAKYCSECELPPRYLAKGKRRR
jgi:hypothetical protein